MDRDLLILGNVVGVHGVRGEIKVSSRSGSSDALVEQENIFLRNPGEPETRRYSVRRARPHKRMALFLLEGIVSVDEARRFVGSEVLVEKDTLPPLARGEYYWYQIQGLQVVTITQEYLGHVEDLIPTPAHDVYVVRGGKEEILIPAVEDVIQRIDLEAGVMTVDLPSGLVSSNAD